MAEQAVAQARMGPLVTEPPLVDRVTSHLRSAGRALRRNPNLLAGTIILTVMTLIAIITATPGAKAIARYEPTTLNLSGRLGTPSSEHWFGADTLGRDVYSRTLHGAKVSLVVAASVAVIVTVIGMAIGIAVGYNRIADNIVMRFMDGMMSFPTLVLALALVATLGSSLRNVILVICIVDTPGMVRVVRGVVLTLRERTYVESARAIGAPVPRILLRHIAPNTFAPVIVQASVYFAGAILTESALGFLGVGTPEYIPSWGNIIATGREYVTINFWISFFPGVFLALTILAANLVGDGLRDVLDPRLRGAM
jgi:peptide/nickel transport system permease protein